MATDDGGPGVHYPDGISGGTHPGPLADCRIPRCIVRRINTKAQQAAETALDQLATAVRKEQARHAAEVRAAALREAADIAEGVALRLHCAHEIERENGAMEVAADLRDRADTIAPPTPAPCPQHPTAPVINGACGGCTQYPADMRPATAQPEAEPAEYTTGPEGQPEWRSEDVDGDRLLITTALIPPADPQDDDDRPVPGLYFRTDRNGSSVTCDQLAALLARLPAIANHARNAAEETTP